MQAPPFPHTHNLSSNQTSDKLYKQKTEGGIFWEELQIDNKLKITTYSYTVIYKQSYLVYILSIVSYTLKQAELQDSIQVLYISLQLCSIFSWINHIVSHFPAQMLTGEVKLLMGSC